ncbi:MAG: tail fiber domain-containing protein [Bacteroidota bacterium]
MKSFIYTLLLVLGITAPLLAQSPGFFNYQAVIRDSDGNISPDQTMTVQFMVRTGSATGPNVYSEVHNTSTNEFGMVNLKIGDGTLASGDLATVAWEDGNYFLEVMIDGSQMGVQELTTVPYSFYANRAATADDDNDRDPANELQTLTIEGRTLRLSDGGTVIVPETPTSWTASGTNISTTNSGNVGIGTNSPRTKLDIHTPEAVGESTNAVSDVLSTTGGVLAAPNIWQSFTAERSGFITSFETFNGRFDVPIAPGTFSIYAGEGTGGTRLHIQDYEGYPANTTWTNFILTTPIEIVAGEQYTIFHNNFNWLFNGGQPYAGGRANFAPNVDYTLRVYTADEVRENTTLAVGYGRVGIGTNAPREKLEVVGNICYTGSIGACSDERYKTNFTAIENPLEKIQQFSGWYYDWKRAAFPERQFTDRRQIGVIAQELETVFPEIVMTDEEGYKSVDYAKLTPILLEAIKAQQAMIESLKSESATFQREIMARLVDIEAKVIKSASRSADPPTNPTTPK